MKIKKIIVIGIGVPIGLFLIMGLIANWTFIGLTKDTFSIDYGIDEVLLSFDTERDFHGDGFSIEVYKLDQTSQEYFKKPPLNFFAKYPKRHYHLGGYIIRKWSQTPQLAEDVDRTKFGWDIGYEESFIIPEDQEENVHKYLSLAMKCLQKKGSYYAMFFRDHPYMDGIDLFIISPNDGLLFKINHQ